MFGSVEEKRIFLIGNTCLPRLTFTMLGSVEEKRIFLIGNTCLPRLTWKSISNYIDISQISKHIRKIFLP